MKTFFFNLHIGERGYISSLCQAATGAEWQLSILRGTGLSGWYSHYKSRSWILLRVCSGYCDNSNGGPSGQGGGWTHDAPSQMSIVKL